MAADDMPERIDEGLDEVKARLEEFRARKGLAAVPTNVEEQIRQRDELTENEAQQEHLRRCRERFNSEVPEAFDRTDIKPHPQVERWIEDLWTLDRREFAATKNGLILIGRPGSGKTQNVWMIIRSLLFDHGYENFRLLKVNDYLEEILRLQHNRTSDREYKSKFASTDILFLDDLGAKELTEPRENHLQDILDPRFEQQLPTVITTNIGIPDWVKRFGGRNASRIGGMCRNVLFPKHDHRTGLDYEKGAN